MIGMQGLASKFDSAVIRDRSQERKEVVASSSLIPLPDILPRPKIKMGAEKAYANAKHYVLVDSESGAILAKNDMDAKVPIASTTKIMTATIALESYKLDDIVTVSQVASEQIGADAYLRPGEKITVLELLYCMLIKSANGAAYAFAENMNDQNEKGTAKFVEAMNNKAKDLGMKNTEYHDPAGLDVTGYSSAYDLSLITKYALRDETFASIVKKDQYVATNVDKTIWHDLKNSNRLVADYHYPGAIGVKTGYMPESGHCLVGAAQRNGHTLIAVILNTYSGAASASADEAKRLLDWGFDNIEWN